MNLLESPFSFLLKYTHLLNQKKKIPSSSSQLLIKYNVYNVYPFNVSHQHLFKYIHLPKKKKKYSPLQFFPTPHQIQYPFNINIFLNTPIYQNKKYSNSSNFTSTTIIKHQIKKAHDNNNKNRY